MYCIECGGFFPKSKVNLLFLTRGKAECSSVEWDYENYLYGLFDYIALK